MHKQYLEELVLNKQLISRTILSFAAHRLFLILGLGPLYKFPVFSAYS